MQSQELREQVDRRIKSGDFGGIKPLLLEYKEITEHDNDLATVCYLCSIYEKEKAAGEAVLFSKVSGVEELLARYTSLKFYLRRIEYDVMDEEGMSAFYQFLAQGQVSVYELLTVTDFSVCQREKVLGVVQGG